jgi:hypothetical protein
MSAGALEVSFALVQLALNLLHALNTANNALSLFHGGLYRAHCPSCASIFPSIAYSLVDFDLSLFFPPLFGLQV